MHEITLNNGEKMPVVGLGTWKSKPGEVGQAVRYAITQAEYRHIDCAYIYRNETEIGGVFKDVFAGGEIKREEVFVTGKLWNTFHAAKDVLKGCKISLHDLQLDYLDLYLMHWGVAVPANETELLDKNGFLVTDSVSIRETWEAMEALVRSGLVKAIGVANFTAPMLIDLLSYTRINPAVNQIELHPYNAQQGLVEFCQNKNITVTAYSPLGSPGNMMAGQQPVLEDAKVLEIAKEYKVSAAQVLIRWAVQRNTVVIPKSVNPNNLRNNIDVFDFDLTAAEMQALSALDKRHHYVDPFSWWKIPYFG